MKRSRVSTPDRVYAGFGTTKRRGRNGGRLSMRKRKPMSRDLVIIPQPHYLPPRIRNHHRYNEIVTITIPAGGVGTYLFNTNGMNKPNAVAAGHQPMGFDQLSDLYNTYTVLSSKCQLKLFDNLGAILGVQYGMWTEDDATIGTVTQFNTVEKPGVVWDTFCSSLTKEPRNLTKYWSAAKVFGPNVSNMTQFQGTQTTNPSEVQCFVIFMTGTPTIAYQIAVSIDFYAEWHELKGIIGS